MKKLLIVGAAALFVAMLAPDRFLPVAGTPYPLAEAAESQQVDSMAQLQLTLRKLEEAMSSMKDFDQLEKAGMPKANVDRMRKAMQIKINQMMDEVIKEIQAL